MCLLRNEVFFFCELLCFCVYQKGLKKQVPPFEDFFEAEKFQCVDFLVSVLSCEVTLNCFGILFRRHRRTNTGNGSSHVGCVSKHSQNKIDIHFHGAHSHQVWSGLGCFVFSVHNMFFFSHRLILVANSLCCHYPYIFCLHTCSLPLSVDK